MNLVRAVAELLSSRVCRWLWPFRRMRPAAVTVVHCPSLFDSTAGKMLGPTTVVISGDKFEKVEPGTQSPNRAPR
jgi:hypothetical protein